MKVKIVKRVLCLALIVMCLPVYSLAWEPVPNEVLYVVKNPNPADRLNLRTQPNTSASSLGRYYNGVRMEALSQPANGWIYVQVEGSVVKGYMQTQYLVHNPSSPVSSAAPLVTINNKNGTGLYVYEQRSTSSSNYGFLKNGETVIVLGWGEQWCHIRKENVTAYMQTSGLSFDTTDSGTPSNPGSSLEKGLAYVKNPVSTDRLNLRESINANGQGGNSMGKYYTGVEVQILEILTKGGVEWAQVRVGATRTGFMQTSFLVKSKPTSAMPNVVVKNPKATDHLNLRAAPNENSTSLGRYQNGTAVVVLGVINSTWSHVKVNGLEGFMMNSYLSPVPMF
jgi:uncharacterized protein YgiM (DUF1202 family)